MTLKNEIISKFTESLLDSKRAFNESDLIRHVDIALKALSEVRPLHKITLIELFAGRSMYGCPEDLIKIYKCQYGVNLKNSQKPWDDSYVGSLPRWHIFNNKDQRILYADPAPNALQIAMIGAHCELIYCAAHVLTESTCSLSTDEVGLLILRAQAEAMREIAIKNTTQAYQLREGISSTPQNGTPAYLYKTLMQEFNARADGL